MSYPSQNFSQAVTNTMRVSDQLWEIINGAADESVSTDSGDIPTLRKTLVDNYHFKDPVPWANGNVSVVFNQLYTFTDGSVWYAPTATTVVPVPMGATPVGDTNWKVSNLIAVGDGNGGGNGGGGGGTSTFLQLTDTPATFGTVGQLLKVNATGTGLEFFSPSYEVAGTKVANAFNADVAATATTATEALGLAVSAGEALITQARQGMMVAGETSFTELGDTPDTMGDAGQYLVVSANGLDIEFKTTTFITAQDKVDNATAADTATTAGSATSAAVADSVEASARASIITDAQAGMVAEGTLSIHDMTDTPSAAGTVGQLLRVNALGDGLEYFTPDFVSPSGTVAYATNATNATNSTNATNATKATNATTAITATTATNVATTERNAIIATARNNLLPNTTTASDIGAAIELTGGVAGTQYAMRSDGTWEAIVGGGGGGASAWGAITGALTDQTDLLAALNLKTNDADLHAVAKSGSYTSLSDTPVVITAKQDSAVDIDVFPTDSEIIRLGGSSQTSVPSWARYGNLLNIVAPSGDTAVQLLSGYNNEDLAFRSGNKSVESINNLGARPFVKLLHENSQIPSTNVVGGLTDAPANGTIYGRKNNTWVSVGSGGSGGGSEYFVDGIDIGLVYNDQTAAKANAQVLRTILQQQVLRLVISNTIYFDFESTPAQLKYGLEIESSKEHTIFWTGLEASLQNQTGCRGLFVPNTVGYFPYYKETNCHHNSYNISGDHRGMKILSVQGYATFQGIESHGCIYEGYTGIDATGREQDPRNPTNTANRANGTWGIGSVFFTDLTILNSMVGFMRCNQMPNKTIVFEKVLCRNMKGSMVFQGTTNVNPHGVAVMAAMGHLVVRDVEWINDDGFTANSMNSRSSYMCIVGHEGYRCTVENLYAKNIVGDGTANAGELYTVYMAGRYAVLNNHISEDMYNYYPTQKNVGLHLKKTWNCQANNIVKRYTPEFFTRQAALGHDITGTHGEFISYHPEPDAPWDTALGYGTAPSQEINITNCRIWLPKLNNTASPTSPKTVGTFIVTDCVFESPDTGTFSLAPVRWEDHTGLNDPLNSVGDHMPESRQVIIKRNKIYVPNSVSTSSRILNLLLKDPRQTRAGLHTVDVSDNDIDAPYLREVTIAASATDLQGDVIPHGNCILDKLKVDNRVHSHVGGTHTLFTYDQKGCTIREMEIGGIWSGDRLTNLQRIDQNVFASGTCRGKFEINYASCDGDQASNYLMLMDAKAAGSLESHSKFEAKTFRYTGTVASDEGYFSFSAGFTTKNITASSMDIDYIDTEGNPQTMTLDGTNQSLVTLKTFGLDLDGTGNPVPVRFTINRSEHLQVRLYPVSTGDSSVQIHLNVLQN